MKKGLYVIKLFLVVNMVTMLLSGCTTVQFLTKTKDEPTLPSRLEQIEVIEQSKFVGEWICLKENSCNGMKIVLTITQANDQLNIVRDMESYSPSGSKITFSVDVPKADSFYSSNTKGTYELQDGILTESFSDGKTNYFSATGELAENICDFPFCSEASGNTTYCDLHNTEEKRYNSLSNSNKKTIGYFIKGRYDYYDELNNGYAGDKYSDKIMQEAADKYGLTTSHIEIIWMNYYSY